MINVPLFFPLKNHKHLLESFDREASFLNERDNSHLHSYTTIRAPLFMYVSASLVPHPLKPYNTHTFSAMEHTSERSQHLIVSMKSIPLVKFDDLGGIGARYTPLTEAELLFPTCLWCFIIC